MASANVKEFNTQNWEQEVVNSTEPVLVDFWAAVVWTLSGTGADDRPALEQYSGKVKVGKLNGRQPETLPCATAFPAFRKC